jgi:CRISPR-associated protein Cas5h
VRGVVFDIEGRFAHFRKIYTNSSSLSYLVPPRTTVQGILAAMLGYERDSYYTKLDKEVFIAVKKNYPTYMMTHTLNYIRAVSTGELSKPKEHTQIPFEVMASRQKVSYRVYVGGDSFTDMEVLIKRLKSNQFVFPPTLGTAFFLADVEFVSELDFKEVRVDDFVPVSTVINSSFVYELKMDEMVLLKEKMPRAFGNGRSIKPAESYFVEAEGKPVNIKISPEYSCWLAEYFGNTEYVMFM